VCDIEGWSGNVVAYCFLIGPDSCSFFAGEILDYFVFYGVEDVLARLIFCVTDICADADEECAALNMLD
jgi:hypothetical protein